MGFPRMSMIRSCSNTLGDDDTGVGGPVERQAKSSATPSCRGPGSPASSAQNIECLGTSLSAEFGPTPFNA
jgi:hypothetical protein